MKKTLAGVAAAATLVVGAVALSPKSDVMKQHRTCVPWPACLTVKRVCVETPRGKVCNTEDADGGE